MLQSPNSNKQPGNKSYAVVHFLWKNQELSTDFISEGKVAWIYQTEARLGSHNKSVGESGVNPFLSIVALFFSLCASEHRVAVFFTCFVLGHLPPLRYLPGVRCAHRRPSCMGRLGRAAGVATASFRRACDGEAVRGVLGWIPQKQNLRWGFMARDLLEICSQKKCIRGQGWGWEGRGQEREGQEAKQGVTSACSCGACGV